MTFFQMLGLFFQIFVLRFFHNRNYNLVEQTASMKMRGEPDIEEGLATYRILVRAIPVSEHRLNFKEKTSAFYGEKQELPLVSCLMVTKNRFQLAKNAINSFREQTYPNRELIILDDSPEKSLRDWVHALGDSKIKFFDLPDESLKLGELRNLSRKHAQGTFIAQWDDDDLSHKDRLLYQMYLILHFNLAGCSLQRETLFFKGKPKAWTNRRMWEGSMIARADILPPYHERVRGEETDAVNQVVQNSTVALLDFPQLYMYSFHGANTFDEPHFNYFWNNATKVFDR